MPALDDRFRFPVCAGCFDKTKHERTYTPLEMMQGCALERMAEAKKLYNTPMEICCLCGGGTISCIYVKDDPRPA